MKKNLIKNLIVLCIISVCFSTSCSSKDNLDPKKTEAISKKLNISNADAKKLYELMLESRAITDADTNITEEEIGTRAKELTDKVTKLLNLSSPLEALLTIGTVSDIIFDSTGTKDTSGQKKTNNTK